MAKYYERRSGKDRRESDNGSPISVERRRTVEKRKLEILEIILSEAEWKKYFETNCKGRKELLGTDEASEVLSRAGSKNR